MVVAQAVLGPGDGPKGESETWIVMGALGVVKKVKDIVKIPNQSCQKLQFSVIHGGLCWVLNLCKADISQE